MRSRRFLLGRTLRTDGGNHRNGPVRCPFCHLWWSPRHQQLPGGSSGGRNLMTIHRSGTMSRRGAHARDTGSTTGIATAVLALLSAGTLASLGLVTADELRGGSSGNLSAPYDDLLPPVAVVVTP